MLRVQINLKLIRIKNCITNFDCFPVLLVTGVTITYTVELSATLAIFRLTDNSYYTLTAPFSSRFHRLLCGKACISECIQPLHQRRQNQALKLLQKTMSSQHILSKHLPPLSSSGRFILPPRNTCKRSKTFFLYACNMYNQLLFQR